MVGRKVSEAVVNVAISVSLLVGASPLSGESMRTPLEDRRVSVLGPRDPRLVRAVSLAVAEASRRLDSAECREVFSEFADASGVPLAAKLEADGHDGRSFLGWLIFRNGEREAFCDRGAVALAADPGGRFVTVCGTRFFETQFSDPGYAAALVIHEELHVLGLGENPPSAAQITARVIARCGR
jgi:hypothetical protein